MSTRALLAGLLVLGASSCAFDEYGFPHFRVDHRVPAPPPYPRHEKTGVCGDGVLDREMLPLPDSPRTLTATEVLRGCGGAWRVVRCADPTHRESGRFFEPLDGGTATFCRPIQSAQLSDGVKVARAKLDCPTAELKFEDEFPEAIVRGCGGAWLAKSCTDAEENRGYAFAPLDGGEPTTCKSPFSHREAHAEGIFRRCVEKDTAETCQCIVRAAQTSDDRELLAKVAFRSHTVENWVETTRLTCLGAQDSGQR